MQIFHYCAAVLRDVPLFESCSDGLIHKEAYSNQEGSVYNDFDTNPMDLLSDASTDDDIEEEENIVRFKSTVGDDDIEKVFLAADQEDYERWSVDHSLFDYQNPSQSSVYIEKVYKLLNEGDWDDLPIYDDMEYR